MSDEEIAKKVRKIDNAMTLEGMPLTEELKQIIRDCLTGVTTPKKEIEKLNKRYKVKHGQ